METRTIPICEHEGYSIDLRMPAGVFDAQVEDTHVTSQNLEDLKARLTALTKKAREQSRRAMKPVSVWMVCKSKAILSFELREVLGLVAGRSYSAILRTKEGQTSANIFMGLAVGDRRIAIVQKIFQQYNDAERAYMRAQKERDVYLESLPHLAVPCAISKEDALDVEPAFLDALRNIPVERDSADRENTQVPA